MFVFGIGLVISASLGIITNLLVNMFPGMKSTPMEEHDVRTCHECWKHGLDQEPWYPSHMFDNKSKDWVVK